MILIISKPGDGHVAPVANELKSRGEEFRVYDPECYPGTSRVTLDSTRNGVRAFLTWDGFVLDLNDVKSAWYRRPGTPLLLDGLHAAEAEWIRSECSHLFRATWGEIRSLWVSEPAAISRSSVKVLQLGIALEMGFTVPRFTVTNDVDHASQFIASCPRGAVVKVLTTPLINYSDHACTLYTHLISKQDLDELESVQFGPTFLQQFVEKTMDIRVTVFGSDVFAVGIQPYTKDALIDFRRAEIYDLPHTILTLPDELRLLCIALVKRLGLNFGAIDLLLTPDGQYVFLELNPNGQWYWMEWMTGVPLTRALCDLLVAGPAAALTI